ncbi:MAG: hypothetical protein U0169_23675 [Polyangiaceae bacterium]
MSTLAMFATKARARRRAREEGATIFIVATTLAVLASLGVYALRSAATEVKTSGHGRQAAQVQYLAEYGLLAGAQDVAGPKVGSYLGLMYTGTTTDSKCNALEGVPASASAITRACRRTGKGELESIWAASLTARSLPTIKPTESWIGTTVPGSLGANPTAGDFYYEVTEPSQAPPPVGYNLALGMCFLDFTVTATGLSYPDVNVTATYNNKVDSNAKYPGASVAVARARVRGGPVQCPK